MNVLISIYFPRRMGFVITIDLTDFVFICKTEQIRFLSASLFSCRNAWNM